MATIGMSSVARADGVAPGALCAAAAAVNVNPFRTGSAATGSTADVRSRRAASDQSLLDARRALAVGDLARAQQFLGQSQQLDVAYDGPGDSPQRVSESIAKGLELAEMRKATEGGETWRLAYAKYLVTQADALTTWNDLETATRAANEAAQMNPRFGATGLTPTSVLRRIAERRQGAGNVASAGATSPVTGPIAAAKSQTIALLAQARTALAAGDLAAAEKLAGQASALNVADSQFGPAEDSPGRLASDLVRARGESGATELTALDLPSTSTPGEADYAQAALAVGPEMPGDIGELPEAAPLPLPTAGAPTPSADDPHALLEAGEQALRAGDRAGALENFKAAYRNHSALDLLEQQRLQGHLQLLAAPSAEGAENVATPDGELLDTAAAGQSVVARQLSADIGKRQSEAARLREKDPIGALRLLREARKLVEDSTLEDTLKRQLLSRVDASIAETEKYITDHKAELELDAANKEILDEIEREHAMRAEVQNRMAEMVDQFNELIDEHRYAEAEVVANRLYAMAPEELVSQQINNQAKFIRRNQRD